MEATEGITPASTSTAPSYLKRHKYELPIAQAQLFDATTQAWEDSGVMPQALQTSLLGIPEATTTSTGGMTETVGGDVAASLSFCNDTFISKIRLPDATIDGSCWELPGGGTMTEAEMMEMMEMVDAATFGIDETLPDIAALDFDWNDAVATAAEAYAISPATDDEDVAFNDHMTFDGVFEMPLDETFGPCNGPLDG